MWGKIEQFLVKNKMAFGLILLIMIIVNTFQYEYNKKHTEDTKVIKKVTNNHIFKNFDKKHNNDDVKQNEVEKEESKKFATPLLYEVTKNDSETKIYLFGSIHVADERAYPLPEIVMNAYNSSDSLAVEFDLISADNNFIFAILGNSNTTRIYFQHHRFDKLAKAKSRPFSFSDTMVKYVYDEKTFFLA